MAPKNPFLYCSDDNFDILSASPKSPKPEKVYRIKRESGEVVLSDRMTMSGSIYLDLFREFIGGSYKTEEEARKAAREYCSKQRETLLAAGEKHSQWLIEHQEQRLQIGDRVGYTPAGISEMRNQLRGMVSPVTAVRKHPERGFEYQVGFPRYINGMDYSTTWFNQDDLVLRRKKDEKPEPKKPEQPEKPEPHTGKLRQEAFELLGKFARPWAEPWAEFRRIKSVRFEEGCEPTFTLGDSVIKWSRNALVVIGADPYTIDEK